MTATRKIEYQLVEVKDNHEIWGRIAVEFLVYAIDVNDGNNPIFEHRFDNKAEALHWMEWA